MAYLLVTPRGKETYRVKLDGASRSAFVVGRAVGADVWIHDAMLSRQHCRFVRDDGRWYVEDMGSTNGTRIGGHRVKQRRELADGETIEVGDSRIVFHTGTHVAARPADPIEAMRVQRMLDDMNDSRITSQVTLLGRGAMSPNDSMAGKKTVVRPQPRDPSPPADATADGPNGAKRSIAFERPPAQPIVEPDDEPNRGWLRSLVAKVTKKPTTSDPQN
jgi:predicted component of type VI protein secretion system